MPYDLPINGDEAHLLLRALAAYSALPETSPRDRSCGTWIVEHILRGFPGLAPDPVALTKALGR